jgi:3-oxoacyl-(acyl-carrier-protein) synthase
VSSRFPIITGLGIVTAAGWNLASVWNSITNGLCGLRPLSLFSSPRHGQHLAGEVQPDLGKLGAPVRGSRSDRLAWLAAREAMETSGLNLADCAERAGVILGCSVGGSFGSEQFLIGLIKHGRMRSRPTRFHECNSSVDFVADAFGCHGPSFAIATACSSSALAIAAAGEMILRGEADAMLAGGTDSLSRMTWGGFHSLLLVDPTGCRPFDSNRAGMCLGEGAGVLVMEAEETARQRGAAVLARLTGWGASCDAYHVTAPHPEGSGALVAMQRALRRAGLSPTEIDYVNAHGTGTRDNDAAESKALKALFGNRVPPFSSTKRFFGHALAASGGIEAVVCVEALRRQQLPPNPGFETVDAAIGLAPVRQLQNAALTHVLSNSFGFGGNNAALIFSKAQTTPGTRPPAFGPVSVDALGVIAPDATVAHEFESPLPQGKVIVRACGPFADAATLSPNQRRRLSRMTQMALLAARRAHTAEPIVSLPSPPSTPLTGKTPMGEGGGREGGEGDKTLLRLAVAMGTGFGCLAEGAMFIENYIAKDEAEPMPARFPGSVHNAPAGQIAIDLGARALNSAPTAGSITFECALWQVMSQLAADEADIVLAGAVDELNKYPLAIGKRWGVWNERTLPGEGAMMARLTRMAGQTPPLARITALRLGRYRRPFDPQREANWIAATIDLAKVKILMSGAKGSDLMEGHYRDVTEALSSLAGRKLDHRTYKQDCGEFLSASGLGFAVAVELVRQRNCGVLLYTLSPRGGKALCLVQP